MCADRGSFLWGVEGLGGRGRFLCVFGGGVKVVVEGWSVQLSNHDVNLRFISVISGVAPPLGIGLTLIYCRQKLIPIGDKDLGNEVSVGCYT